MTHQNFPVKQCSQCGLKLTSPRPNETSIGSYYKSDQYVSHSDTGGGLLNSAYRVVRNYTLQSKQHLVSRLNNGPGLLLDVGCGTGTFLNVCQQAGWQVSGTEPDQAARTVANEKLRIKLESNLEALKSDKPFDIITMWHVLEHVSELNETVKRLRTLLSNSGTLLVAVPNCDSYDAQKFGPHWAAYDVPRHLYHFVPATIEQLFVKHQFKLVGQRPLLLDAFYIAMLSTQYQSGRVDYLKSVEVGLRSNSDGKKTGNYSSNLYLFKKQ